MSVSTYSIIMAILWLDIFIFLNSILRRKTGVLLQYSLFPLLLLSLFGLFRVLFPIEIPKTVLLESNIVYPWLQSIWNYQFCLFSYSIFLYQAIVIGFTVVSVFLLVRLFLRIRKDMLYIDALYTEEDERANQVLREIAGPLKKEGFCTIRLVPNLYSPIITGFFHPVILLPYGIQELSEEQLRYILQHEWCHFQSKDLWTKLLIHVLCCVMWWNPPIHQLRKDFEQVLELNCDQRITAKMQDYERIAYLETMLEMLKRSQGKPTTNAIGVGFIGDNQASNTVQRFQMVYDRQNNKPTWRTNVFLIAIMTIFFCASYSFILQPYTPAPDSGGESLVIDAENSYLEQKSNGDYYLYINNQKIDVIPKDEILVAPYNTLPIF